MFDPIIILCALACGLLVRSLGQPALLGYLAAGFVLHELGATPGPMLQTVADLGVTLLLFTIGLKLEPAQLIKARVWGTAVLHMVLMQGLFTALLLAAISIIPGVSLGIEAVLIVAFALTFSSTVFVIQSLQERGEINSRHASLAIGILIIQDLAAVIFIAASTGKVPNPEGLLILLVFPLRPVILRLLSLSGHGELFTLFGLAIAIIGAEIFDNQGIKGDLAALVLGAALSGHQKAKELSKNLLYFKDLFLVGFFLTIGLSGWPQAELLVLAMVIGALCLVKPPLYFLLMTRFHTPPRTAVLSSAALANFSEFGLIIAAIAVKAGWLEAQWAATISLIVAVSFVISSPLNIRAHDFYRRYQARLNRFQSEQLRAGRPRLHDARMFVLGMGRIGTGAYEAMFERHGNCVVGVDDNDQKLREHLRCHRRCVSADASDPDFWACVDFNRVELVMLALTNHEENKLVAKLLRSLGYKGRITAVVRFREEAEELEKKGVNAFNLFEEAGTGFASHADAMLVHTGGQRSGLE